MQRRLHLAVSKRYFEALVGGVRLNLVFGATGTVGEALLPALAGEHEVTAVSRSADEGVRDSIRWVEGDVEDGESVDRALEGAEVVYYLVHSLGTTGFEERERRSADNVARAAENAGLRQIVYLGGLGEDSDDLSPHLRSRRETEGRLASGSVPVTTLRAAMVVGDGSAAFETVAALVDRLPVMILPRWAKTPTQPIALADACATSPGFAESGGFRGRPTTSPARMS